MTLRPLDITTFEETIYDRCETCLVTFGRKNCHVCSEVVPMVEEIAEDFSNKMNFYYIDIEEQRDLFARFSLRGVPQLLFFKDGEFRGKLGGMVEEGRLKEKIEDTLNG